MPILLPPHLCLPDRPGLHLIVGDPIGHSLSPLIYNTLYQRYGIPVQAMTCRVTQADLPGFFALLSGLDICALNVTIPHKEGVIPHLYEVDSDALAQRSVNTIVPGTDGLYGYSTDGLGFSLSLQKAGLSMAGKRVLLLGNGGAAASIAWQAMKDGAKSLTVLGRKTEKAAQVLKSLPQNAETTRAAGNMDTIEKHAASCDMLVNATPLGMAGFVGGDFPNLRFLAALPKTAAVCDIVYRPARTALLAKAEALGLQTLGGLGMLVCQAMASFQIFYGFAPSSDDRAAISAAAAARLLG